MENPETACLSEETTNIIRVVINGVFDLQAIVQLMKYIQVSENHLTQFFRESDDNQINFFENSTYF